MKIKVCEAWLADQLRAVELELESTTLSLVEERKLKARFMENFVSADAEDHVVLGKSKFDQLARDAKARSDAEAERTIIEQWYKTKLERLEERQSSTFIELKDARLAKAKLEEDVAAERIAIDRQRELVTRLGTALLSRAWH